MAQVLTPIFIRRRRKVIAEIYGNTATIGGELVSFPTPKLNSLSHKDTNGLAGDWRCGKFTGHGRKGNWAGKTTG